MQCPICGGTGNEKTLCTGCGGTGGTGGVCVTCSGTKYIAGDPCVHCTSGTLDATQTEALVTFLYDRQTAITENALWDRAYGNHFRSAVHGFMGAAAFEGATLDQMPGEEEGLKIRLKVINLTGYTPEGLMNDEDLQ